MTAVLPKDRLDAIRFSLDQSECDDYECEMLRAVLEMFVLPLYARDDLATVLARVRTTLEDCLRKHAHSAAVRCILQHVLITRTTATLVEDDARARLAAIAELALALLRFNEHVHP